MTNTNRVERLTSEDQLLLHAAGCSLEQELPLDDVPEEVADLLGFLLRSIANERE